MPICDLCKAGYWRYLNPDKTQILIYGRCRLINGQMEGEVKNCHSYDGMGTDPSEVTQLQCSACEDGYRPILTDDGQYVKQCIKESNTNSVFYKCSLAGAGPLSESDPQPYAPFVRDTVPTCKYCQTGYMVTFTTDLNGNITDQTCTEPKGDDIGCMVKYVVMNDDGTQADAYCKSCDIRSRRERDPNGPDKALGIKYCRKIHIFSELIAE